MDFTLPETHVELADLATTILTASSSPERLTQLERGDWFDRDAWRDLADAGLLGTCLPAEVGGLQLDQLAMHGLLRAVGATAAHVPLFETLVLGATAVLAAPEGHLRRQVLEGVVAGRRVLTAALHDEDGGTLLDPTTVAEPSDGGVRLQGAKALVSCATIADAIVVPARTPAGELLVALVATDATGVTVEAQRTPSDVPHARVVLDGVEVDRDHVLARGADAEDLLVRLQDLGRAGLASMQSGLVAAAIRLAADHTSTREQFGRPLATFQAVSQRLADARIAQEMLDLTSLQAAWLLSKGLPATEELLIAAWWTCEAGHHALHAAHHVHGGIGVDREYPLHRLFGRAKLAEFVLGNAEDLLADLGQRIAAEPALADHA